MQISDFKNKPQKNAKEIFRGENIHVVGASGQEGRSAIRFLAKCKAKITSHDFCEKRDFKKNYISYSDYLGNSAKKEKDFEEFIKISFKQNFKGSYLKGIENANGIFVPQSWFRYEFNNKLKGLQKKITFYSTTDILLHFSKAITVGVTGTNGKSTTSRLVANILKQTGKKIWFSGNDRELEPLADKVFDMKKEDFLVLEISNRQLLLTTVSPHIAVITNITPNHLDDHGSFADYVTAKKKILEFQNKEDFAVLNYDDKRVRGFLKDTRAKVWYFSLAKKKCIYWEDKKTIFIKDGDKKVKIDKITPLLFGEHNMANILAAVLASYLVGAKVDEIRKGINTFREMKHRLELVREFKGVKYYNDSQSTSPASLFQAIDTFKDSPREIALHPDSSGISRGKPSEISQSDNFAKGKIISRGKSLILIAGGFRKGAVTKDYKEVVELLSLNTIKRVFLMGETGKLIAQLLQGTNVYFELVASLDEAVKKAYNIAKSGDVVVMSPGAESFGIFRDYRERGEKFRKLVGGLK